MKQSSCARTCNTWSARFGRLAGVFWLVMVLATGCVGAQTRPMATPTLGPGTERLILRPVLPEGRKLLEADRKTITQILFRRAACLTARFDVRWQSDERIIVTLGDIRNPDTAARTLVSPGRLEFVESTLADLGAWQLEAGFYVRTSANQDAPDPTIHGAVEDPFPNQVFHTVLGGQHVKDAYPVVDPDQNVTINVNFTDEGAKILAHYTMQHVGEVLIVVLDNIVLMAPRIESPIIEGNARIGSGPEKAWTVEEAGCMTAMMNGMLPFPLELVERSEGSSLASNR